MLTQRLGSATQKNPEFIDKLVNTIKNNPGSCDEVWFALSVFDCSRYFLVNDITIIN